MENYSGIRGLTMALLLAASQLRPFGLYRTARCADDTEDGGAASRDEPH